MLKLICCCCLGPAPAKKQWFNRDRGYGLCGRCADWMRSVGEGLEDFRRSYGVEGVHWMPDTRGEGK